MRYLALLALLTVIPAAHAIVVIDDFSGDVTSVITSSVTPLAYDSSSAAVVPGGVRYLGQAYTGATRRAAAAVTDGTLIVSTPIRAETTTALAYGNIGSPNLVHGPSWSTLAGPNFSLGGFDTLRLNFLSNEQDLFVRFVIQADWSYDVYEKTVAGSQYSPFSVDLLASDRVLNSANVSLSNFDTLFISFQSSNAGDFEVGSLQAVPEPATMAILGLGLAAAAARRRRK